MNIAISITEWDLDKTGILGSWDTEKQFPNHQIEQFEQTPSYLDFDACTSKSRMKIISE